MAQWSSSEKGNCCAGQNGECGGVIGAYSPMINIAE
jgi:hypothetical protein